VSRGAEAGFAGIRCALLGAPFEQVTREPMAAQNPHNCMQFRELKHFDGCVCTDTDSPSFQAHLLTTGLPL
jgi:hypothetical protein